jgi:hypothetical protein
MSKSFDTNAHVQKHKDRIAKLKKARKDRKKFLTELKEKIHSERNLKKDKESHD